MRGKHIVIEGGDGAGKSSQARRLATRLDRHHIPNHMVREPDHPGIREVMLSNENDFDELTRLFLVNAARVETAREIAVNLDNSRWVLADRSMLSSVAMQGYAADLGVDRVREMSDWAAGGWEPDMVILLDAPDEVLRERAAARGGTDTYEERGPEWHNRVNEGYRAEASRIGAVIVDATASVEEVHSELWAHVRPIVDDWHAASA